MWKIDDFRPIYQKFLESGKTVRKFCSDEGIEDCRYKIDSNLVENGQRPVAVGRKGYLFCGNDDAAEDAAVMYTMMGCCKIAEVNVEHWLTYFLEHVHDYDNGYNRDLAELLPSELKRKGLIA